MGLSQTLGAFGRNAQFCGEIRLEMQPQAGVFKASGRSVGWRPFLDRLPRSPLQVSAPERGDDWCQEEGFSEGQGWTVRRPSPYSGGRGRPWE